MDPLLATAIICALIIVIIVPADVWKMLLVLGTLFVVGTVGFWAFILWMGGFQ